MTLSDSMERCLKKGKGEEQSAAAMCSILLLIQLGSGDNGEETLRSLYPVLKVIMLDNSASFAARAAVSSKARFPLPELTGDRIPLPVNKRAFPLAELTGNGNRSPVNLGR